MERFTVLKDTGTHADVIAAVGAADVLCNLEPRLIDCGDRFEIRLSRPATPRDFARTQPGFLYLARRGQRRPKLRNEWIFDPGKPKVDASDQRKPRGTASMHPEQRMYTLLGRLNAAGGPNRIVEAFSRMPRGEWTQQVWTAFQGNAKFGPRPLLVQLFHPHAARGYSLVKPSGTDRNDKSKNKWSDPFLEWLRYRGFFTGCAGWFLDKDIRLFAPVPNDIPYTLYRDVAAQFRALRLAGSVPKVDCRAVLGLAAILMNRSKAGIPPANLIRSVAVAHYRNMGQSNTLMSIQQLSLPPALDLRTIYEHDRIIKGLSDNRSEEIALLQQYRNLLQPDNGGALAEFAKFLMEYGAHAFRRLLENGPRSLSTFTIHNADSMLRRDMTCQTILENRGFQAVSRALRASTVNAVAARNNDAFDPREVRYGVIGQIRRSLALGKHEFLTAVSAFVADFNEETARRSRLQRRDTRIAEEDVTAFAMLVDSAPSAELIGSMLCALATCQRGDAATGDSTNEKPAVELTRTVSA